jgi:LamB/YcsF family
MAHAVCDTADMFKAPLLGMVGTLHETIYEKRGHVFLSEYYTDLDYGDDGQLAITREHEEVNSSGGGGTQPEGHPREPAASIPIPPMPSPSRRRCGRRWLRTCARPERPTPSGPTHTLDIQACGKVGLPNC